MPEPRPPQVNAQFDDADQQRETAAFGMWVFLATEVLFFGALFAAFTVYRYLYPDGFQEGGRHMDVMMGTVNTIVLLMSSFTMAAAVDRIKAGERAACRALLAVTATLGVIFLGIKFTEYVHHWQASLAPGLRFAVTAAAPAHVELFFWLYFFMTGLHALHLTIGVVTVFVLAVKTEAKYSAAYHNPVEVAGLYWHFVDIVWVFLYPTFYLINLPK